MAQSFSQYFGNPFNKSGKGKELFFQVLWSFCANASPLSDEQQRSKQRKLGGNAVELEVVPFNMYAF